MPKDRGLMHWAGNIYLTPEEKEFRLEQLAKEIADGEVDEQFYPYLIRLNAMPYVVTTQCCCGHAGKKTPHFDIRTSISFEKLFRAVSNTVEKFGITVHIMGFELGLPRFVFWMEARNWRKATDALVRDLEKGDL